MKTLFALAAIVVTLPFVSNAQQVVRGPYLQNPNWESFTIRWRTDAPATSKVQVGTSQQNLNIVVDDTAMVTDHEVMVTGLQPDTKYYYTIGSSNGVIEGPSPNMYCRTWPTPGTDVDTRVWVIGDFGKGNTGQRNVRDSYLNYAQGEETDLWLWLGDNAYDDGTDQEYQDKVFDSVNAYHHIFKQLPFMPTPGNHDYNSVNRLDPPLDHEGPYYDIVSVPQNGESGGVASGSELFYSFDYGDAHFLSINSELQAWTGAVSLSGFNGSPMTDWIEDDLQNNDKTWTIAYFHQPPFSQGSHDSDDFFEVFMQAMRDNIIPILEDGGVDLVLSGHSHVYERSYLMNGFYGSSGDFDPATDALNSTSGNDDLGEAYIKYTDGPDAGKGTVYVVCGNSGSHDDNPDLNHNVFFFGDGGNDGYGSFIIDISGNRLDGKYLRSDGNILDEFTIYKQSSNDTTSITSVDEEVGKVQIYPNPFSKITNVQYTVTENAAVRIEIHSLNGKLIKTIDQGDKAPGTYKLTLNGDSWGLAAGNYIINVVANNKVRYNKLVKLN